MFSELNQQFKKTKKFYFNDEVIVINAWSDRLKLFACAILIPALCAYFYYQQFGCKYVQFGLLQESNEKVSSLLMDNEFNTGKSYIFLEKASGKTFTAIIVDVSDG